MEDAHSFVVDFAGVRGQGFFAVFDGHAGKHAAEWCGQHFHEASTEIVLLTPNFIILAYDSISLTLYASPRQLRSLTSLMRHSTTSTDVFLASVRNLMERFIRAVQL